ncbi:MAG: glycosyltransferase [Clostridia bacterium]|nr:glycosyltransferase [Clostridia bacterium]
MMKILFVVDNYMGGAGNIIQLLATEYAKTEDVSVLLTHKTIEKRYECPGVKFIELDANDKPTGFRVFPFQVKWVRKRVKEEKPDIVISFITQNSIMLCLGQLKSTVPIIACERINPLVATWKFPWNYLLRKAYDRADLLTVQFDEFRKLCNGRYIDKCRVTPNYIATPDKVKDISQKGEITRFVSCGRLNDSKQFDVLLDMFAEIHKANPKTDLKIYGHGPHKERLEQQIKDLGLEGTAMLAGYTTDTYGVLCESDIYLMSSKNEGFPNALSEAMAVGLPSVSFRCNGGVDVLADYGRRGIVVPLNDKDAFVKEALNLCADREKYEKISKNAKEVCEVYSIPKVKAIWDECIREAIRKKGSKKK